MMQEHEKIRFTKRDRLMRAWENSMELTRNFELYAKEITDDEQTSAVFKEFAEDEAVHAARLREMLHDQPQGE